LRFAFTRNESDAADLVQQAFFTLIQQLPARTFL
jgi:DNA-directed RNA polymerase specialized sigma24 family protein